MAWVQIAAATLSGNRLRQTVHIHCASVHQAAKLAAALLRVARVTAGLVVAYRQVYDSRHLQADCQQPGSAPEPYARNRVWYGMVNVDLYSAIITRVSNALNTLVSGEKPGFQALSKGLIVLLCTEVVRQGVPDHGAVHSGCSSSNSG